MKNARPRNNQFVLFIIEICILSLLFSSCEKPKITDRDIFSLKINENHNHDLVVYMDDIKECKEKTYQIKGTSLHDHSITLTTEDFEELKKGNNIKVESSISDLHSHIIDIEGKRHFIIWNKFGTWYSKILVFVGFMAVIVLIFWLMSISYRNNNHKIKKEILNIINREPFPLKKYLIKLSLFGDAERYFEINFDKINRDIYLLPQNERISILAKIEFDISEIKKLIGNYQYPAPLTLGYDSSLEYQKDINAIGEAEIFFSKLKDTEPKDDFSYEYIKDILKPKKES